MNAHLAIIRRYIRSLGVFSLVLNVLTLTSAIFMLQVFDRVIPSQSTETLLVLFVGAGLALALLLIVDYLRSRLQGLTGSIVDERLSGPVAEAVVAQAARSGGLPQSDAIRDVATLRNLLSAAAVTALFDAPWMVVYIVLIAAFHPILGAAAAVACLLMLAIAWYNDRVTRASIENVQKEARRAQHYIDGSLRNAEVVHALGMTNALLARWRAHQDRVAGLQFSLGSKSVGLTSLTRFLRQFIQVAVMALGAYLVLTQQASPGVMIATTVVLGRALQPVEQLVGSWRLLSQGRASFRRLRDLFAAQAAQEPAMSLPRPAGRLSVEGVSFRLPGQDRLILSGVAFELAAGEALAIIGPSGAGKSTLARLITGIWAPMSGAVRLDGANIAQWPRHDLGPWMGYAPQDNELFEGTVADNIARLGPVDGEAVVRAAQRANCHSFILSLPHGYDSQVGVQGALLSPGQRQRIALARALYGDPRLVVLDEPNANLDGAGEIALAQALSGLRSEGITSVVVTHRPSLIAHVDKILVLDGGRVQQFGPAGEVMKWLQRQSQVAVAAAERVG